MKKKNIWLPISILMGIMLAGAVALSAYILITGRSFYSSLPEYTLSEEASLDVISIDQVSATGSYKELELDGFSVPSKAGKVKKDADSDKADSSEEDVVAEGAEEEDDEDIHDYEVIIDNVDWEKAFDNCKRKGGYLARINTDEEYEAVKRLLDEKDFRGVVYLGGMRTEDSHDYHWVNEDMEQFPSVLNGRDYDGYWLEGEPSFEDDTTGDPVDEEYVAMMYVDRQGGWVWNDVPGNLFELFGDAYDGRVAYVCEYD